MLVTLRADGSHRMLTMLSTRPQGRYGVNSAFIRPVLFLTQPTKLEMGVISGCRCPYKPSDEGIEELAKAMLELRSLCFGLFPCSHLTNSTIKGLASIAKYYKPLGELVIHINVEAVISRVSQRGYWGGDQTSEDPLSIFIGCPVRSIIFGPCPISNEAQGAMMFALALPRLFPRLNWGSAHTPKLEGDPP